MKNKHTPTPWYTAEGDEGEGFLIAQKDGGRFKDWRVCRVVGGSAKEGVWPSDDAAFIVRAVNAHEELLEALKLLVADAIDTHGKGTQGALDYAKEVIEKIEKGESHGTNQKYHCLSPGL